MHDVEQVSAAQAAGLYYSSINPSAYSAFDREHFVGTLNDWGYFGAPDKTPPWYSGLAWGESSVESET
ncbi:MAG TPA: hypothetical protein VFR33_13875 [Candidatus Dormibacteraeota bacterium]|nr:hypothetical protein [Candidatus Dormibacteraeota bacterium]